MIGRLTSIVLIIASITLFFFTIVGKRGIIHLNEVNQELEFLEDKNRQLKTDIAKIENEIYGIQTSDVVLEEKSREHLGLSKAGEIVYIIKDLEEESSLEKPTQEKLDELKTEQR